MTAPQFDPNLLAYLQAWRQYLEQLAGTATMGLGLPAAAQWPMAAGPPMQMPPAMPPMPPPLVGPPAYSSAPPTDYTQQLLMTLQAWRQYLEQSAAPPAAPEYLPPSAAYQESRPHQAKVPVPPPHEGGKSSRPPSSGSQRRPVGSAYATESGSGGYGDTAPPEPKSLYSAAATPDSGATTSWWNTGSTTTEGTSTSSTQDSTPTSGSDPDNGTGQSDGGGSGGETSGEPPKVTGATKAYELKRPGHEGGQIPSGFRSLPNLQAVQPRVERQSVQPSLNRSLSR